MFWAFLTAVAIGFFWLGYRHPRRRRWLLPRPGTSRLTFSSVDRQHKHLLAGGGFGETAIENAAARFRELLRNGRTHELERQLHPGTDFALQVQALASIGTLEAGNVLERQLSRPLSRDPIEQTWYWVDTAIGLRQLRRFSALPLLLRCCDRAVDSQPGVILAAEVVAFPNFSATLKEWTGPCTRSALRAVVSVARGCREGLIDPGSVLAIGVGNILATLSNSAPPIPDPWLTTAILEAERMHRRIGQWGRLLAPEFKQLVERQGFRLWETAGQRKMWLKVAQNRLIDRFSIASTDEQTAILRCLLEFHSDVIVLFPHLPDRRTPWWKDAVRCLTWSKSSVVGPVLASQAHEFVTSRRNHHRATILLAALRGHPCPESEQVLLRATESINPNLRQSAVSALGWWPPYNPSVVLSVLEALRTDPILAETRQSAIAALARLGVRRALDEIREKLLGEEPAIRALTAKMIAQEELSWLWPELQDAADSDEPQLALAAIEAVERLREHAVGIAN